MMDSVNWSQAILIFVTVMVIGIIPLSRIFMEKTVRDVTNMKSSQLFVGPASAITIDYQTDTISYVRVFSKMVFSVKPWDLAVEERLDYELKDTRPKGIIVPMVHSVLSGNYLLSISTNLYDLPEISIAFPKKEDAQRCVILLREFTKRAPQQDKNAPTRDTLIKALEKRMRTKGKSNKGINQRERDDHICHLLNNMEKICGRPWKHGDNSLIADAMFHFFGCGNDDPSGVGYKYSTLKAAVTDCKKSIFKK